MSINVSVKDSLYNEGDRYEFDINAEIEPINYMGNVRFEDVNVSGFYFADGNNVRFYGMVNVKCIFECDRCLKEFDKSFSFNFSEIFSSVAEDETLLIGKNSVVDLQPLVNDTVISSLPIERLCKEDCKGLCPHCGIDKNFSSCTCSDIDEDNPFAILRGLVD